MSRRRPATSSSQRRRKVVIALIAATLLSPALPQLRAAAQQSPTPAAQGYRGADQAAPYTGEFSDLAYAIDAFWGETLDTASIPYRSPAVVPIDQVLDSGCGLLSPGFAALYCAADATIYLSPYFLAEQEQTVGDYAPITILAHEWGHHIQTLTHAPNPGGNTVELQADCLAGVYTQHAEAQGLLDPGDITEAVTMSESGGDPLGLPQDRPGSHGINDDRIKAFMRGYLNGLDACDLPLYGVSTVEQESGEQESGSARPASAYLPTTLPVSSTTCFSVQGQGAYPYEEVVSFLSEAGAGPEEIRALGWQDGAYIDFRCATPPPGGAAFLEVVLHRFESAEAARSAVPYWQTGYNPSQANEVYICGSAGTFVACADGNAPSGPPRADVRALLDQVLASVT